MAYGLMAITISLILSMHIVPLKIQLVFNLWCFGKDGRTTFTQYEI